MLGIEALQRFVKRESLRRVHECAFGFWRLKVSQWTASLSGLRSLIVGMRRA